MQKRVPLLLALVFLPLFVAGGELWDHMDEIDNVRNLRADFSGSKMQLEVAPDTVTRSGNISWATIPPPANGWDFTYSEKVEVKVKNNGTKPAEITLWVASEKGWDAVGAAATPAPGETVTLSCDLRETYPDGTPKIDPGMISEIRIMIQRARQASFEIAGLQTTGEQGDWTQPVDRLTVPEMESGEPAAGKRMKYKIADYPDGDLYCVLYLPEDWQPGKKWPVIAEYPGNIFYRATACWSTGRPEQCVIGYGVTRGAGAIWVSLPFVDIEKGEIAESGFGSNQGEDTTAFALAAIDEIVKNFGGDRENLVLSGFSRGAISCGYIGLRNEKIALLWKGFIACQHYDGSRWKQSNLADAVVRAPRFQGKSIYQIDNSREKYLPVEEATDQSVKWIWDKSGLGYHATAMFLDDRPMMQRLRKWYWDLVGE